MGEPLRWLGGSLNSNYFVSIDSQGRGEARHLRVFYTALKKSVDNSEQGLQDRMHLLEELTNLVLHPYIQYIYQFFKRKLS
jgi:hypothetical protein